MSWIALELNNPEIGLWLGHLWLKRKPCPQLPWSWDLSTLNSLSVKNGNINYEPNNQPAQFLPTKTLLKRKLVNRYFAVGPLTYPEASAGLAINRKICISAIRWIRLRGYSLGNSNRLQTQISSHKLFNVWRVQNKVLFFGKLFLLVPFEKLVPLSLSLFKTKVFFVVFFLNI